MGEEGGLLAGVDVHEVVGVDVLFDFLADLRELVVKLDPDLDSEDLRALSAFVQHPHSCDHLAVWHCVGNYIQHDVLPQLVQEVEVLQIVNDDLVFPALRIDLVFPHGNYFVLENG